MSVNQPVARYDSGRLECRRFERFQGLQIVRDLDIYYAHRSLSKCVGLSAIFHLTLWTDLCVAYTVSHAE